MFFHWYQPLSCLFMYSVFSQSIAECRDMLAACAKNMTSTQSHPVTRGSAVSPTFTPPSSGAPHFTICGQSPWLGSAADLAKLNATSRNCSRGGNETSWVCIADTVTANSALEESWVGYMALVYRPVIAAWSKCVSWLIGFIHDVPEGIRLIHGLLFKFVSNFWRPVCRKPTNVCCHTHWNCCLSIWVNNFRRLCSKSCFESPCTYLHHRTNMCTAMSYPWAFLAAAVCSCRSSCLLNL